MLARCPTWSGRQIDGEEEFFRTSRSPCRSRCRRTRSRPRWSPSRRRSPRQGQGGRGRRAGEGGEAQIEVEKAEAAKIAERIKVLGRDGYLKQYAIDKGLNPYQPTHERADHGPRGGPLRTFGPASRHGARATMETAEEDSMHEPTTSPGGVRPPAQRGVAGRVAVATPTARTSCRSTTPCDDDAMLIRTSPYSVLGTYGRDAVLASRWTSSTTSASAAGASWPAAAADVVDDPEELAEIRARPGNRALGGRAAQPLLCSPWTEVTGRRLGDGWDPFATSRYAQGRR